MTGIVTKAKILRPDLELWDGKLPLAGTRRDSTAGTVQGPRLNNTVDILSVYGGGTEYTSATLADALRSVGTAVCAFEFAPGTWTIDTTDSIPSTVSVVLSAGAILSISSGVTLTIAGHFVALGSTYTSGAGTLTLNGSVDSRDYKLNLRDPLFGATGDGSTDDTTAVHAWLDAAISQGKVAYAPKGTYKTDVYTTNNSMDNDLFVECEPGAIFEYNTTAAAPLFTFQHSVTGLRRFQWKGGTIDNTGGTLVAPGLSNECINLNRFKDVLVDGVTFQGASDYIVASTAGLGGTDTGIAFINCNNVKVEGCFFYGQGDSGLYFNSDGFGDISVIGCEFEQCWLAAQFKKGISRASIIGNNINNCDTGFTCLASDDDAAAKLGADAIVFQGNTFHKLRRRALNVIAPGRGVLFQGNIVKDWGYELDGSTPKTTEADGVRLLGATDCQIKGNHFVMEDWADHADIRGIEFNETTIDSVLRTPIDNLIEGNSFRNVQTGIRESNTDGLNNRFIRNWFKGVTTPFNLRAATEAVIIHDDTGRFLYSTASTGNVGAGTDDLQTVTLPADTLHTDGRTLHVVAWGVTANNANAKTLTLDFGGTVLLTEALTVSQSNTWRIEAFIIRASATEQRGNAVLSQTSSTGGGTRIFAVEANAGLAEDETADIIIKCTGTATSDNDIVQHGMTVVLVY